MTNINETHNLKKEMKKDMAKVLEMADKCLDNMNSVLSPYHDDQMAGLAKRIMCIIKFLQSGKTTTNIKAVKTCANVLCCAFLIPCMIWSAGIRVVTCCICGGIMTSGSDDCLKAGFKFCEADVDALDGSKPLPLVKEEDHMKYISYKDKDGNRSCKGREALYAAMNSLIQYLKRDDLDLAMKNRIIDAIVNPLVSDVTNSPIYPANALEAVIKLRNRYDQSP